MAKQDVLDAINATIVPNGAKAINADSLRNVLTMMTENAGEGGGSGDGALRVMVPDTTQIGPEILAIGELTPASWATLKSEIEGVRGIDLSVYDAAVNASFAHNASVAQQILEKAKEGKGVSVVLDQTPFLSAVLESQSQMDPSYSDTIEEAAMLGVQPAGVVLQYMKPTPAGESTLGGELFDCSLIPTGYINDTNTGAINYPSTAIIHLNLDGSLLFEELEEEQPTSASEVVTFYMPSDGENLTSEQKSKNAIGVATLVKASSGGYTPPVSICTQISYGINQYQTPLLYVVTAEGIEIHLTAFNVSSGAFEENVFGISTDGSILTA